MIYDYTLGEAIRLRGTVRDYLLAQLGITLDNLAFHVKQGGTAEVTYVLGVDNNVSLVSGVPGVTSPLVYDCLVTLSAAGRGWGQIKSTGQRPLCKAIYWNVKDPGF